jgi:hypothetical protein
MGSWMQEIEDETFKKHVSLDEVKGMYDFPPGTTEPDETVVCKPDEATDEVSVPILSIVNDRLYGDSAKVYRVPNKPNIAYIRISDYLEVIT